MQHSHDGGRTVHDHGPAVGLFAHDHEEEALADEDVETVMELRVTGRGDPAKIHEEHLRFVCKALHRVVGDGWTLSFNGSPVTYDPLADDGHHVGHTKVLTMELDPAERARRAAERDLQKWRNGHG